MTEEQWLFHYLEILEHRKEQMQFYSNLISTIQIAGTLSHKDIDIHKVMDVLRKMEGGPTPEEMAQEAVDYIKEHEDIFPETLVVKIEPKKEAPMPKGRLDRKRGIIIES